MFTQAELFDAGTTLRCKCGNKIDITECKKDVVRDLTVISPEASDEFNISCTACLRSYDVTLAFDLVIKHDMYTSEVKEAPSEIYFPNIFSSVKNIGDSVDLRDGDYKYGEYIYEVENNKIVSIFNAVVDENQLTFDDLLHV